MFDQCLTANSNVSWSSSAWDCTEAWEVVSLFVIRISLWHNFQDHLKNTKRHRYLPEIVRKAILLQARPSLQIPHGGQLRSGHLDWLREQCPCDVGKGCKMFFLENLSSFLQLLQKKNDIFFFIGNPILRWVVVKNTFLECSLFFTTFGD